MRSWRHCNRGLFIRRGRCPHRPFLSNGVGADVGIGPYGGARQIRIFRIEVSSVKLLILNGPNLNLLGNREPEIYGNRNYSDLCNLISAHAAAIGVEADIRQTNHEGVLVDWIQEARGSYDGIVLNPAAYTHTSVALLDAVLAAGVPTVELHISDPDTREPFRRISYVRPACVACVKGHGLEGYLEAMDLLKLKMES